MLNDERDMGVQCAVVGSSDAMLGKGKGREIDEHTAVIRFNDAPTRGAATRVSMMTRFCLTMGENG